MPSRRRECVGLHNSEVSLVRATHRLRAIDSTYTAIASAVSREIANKMFRHVSRS